MWYLSTLETSFLPWVPRHFFSRAAAVYLAKPNQLWGQNIPSSEKQGETAVYALFCDTVERFCGFDQTFRLAAQIALESVPSKIEKYYLQI